MKIQYHFECLECGAITVTAREAKWGGDIPIVHVPFSVGECAFRCVNCGTIWGVDVEMTNLTKQFGDEVKEDLPSVEGISNIGRIRGSTGGGLSI